MAAGAVTRAPRRRASPLRAGAVDLGYALPRQWFPAMAKQRSLKHEYELYVEHELETYKDSVPRSALLALGDEAGVGSQVQIGRASCRERV